MAAIPPIPEPFKIRQKRAHIACTNCRSSKVKCCSLSSEAGCSRCQQRGLDCVYEPVNPSSTNVVPVDSMGSVSPIAAGLYDNHEANNQGPTPYIANPPTDTTVERTGMSFSGWSNGDTPFSPEAVPTNSTVIGPGSAQTFDAQQEYSALTYGMYDSPYYSFPQLGAPSVQIQSMTGPVYSASQVSAEEFDNQNRLLQYGEVEQFLRPPTSCSTCFCESCAFMIAETEGMEISVPREF